MVAIGGAVALLLAGKTTPKVSGGGFGGSGASGFPLTTTKKDAVADIYNTSYSFPTPDFPSERGTSISSTTSKTKKEAVSNDNLFISSSVPKEAWGTSSAKYGEVDLQGKTKKLKSYAPSNEAIKSFTIPEIISGEETIRWGGF